jgi:hypothetical protein
MVLLVLHHGFCRVRVRVIGLRLLHGAYFRQQFTLENAIDFPRLLDRSEHTCDQWHPSRVFTPLTGGHCKLRQNTEGLCPAAAVVDE